MTSETLEAPRKRGKLVQAIALAGLSILFVTTAMGLANGLLGNVAWPVRVSTPAAIVHVAVAFAALPLTIVQLARRKGDLPHRTIGYIWSGLLLGGALVSFFIQELTGGFSPPHLFAIMTVIFVPWLVYAARTGRRKTHRNLVLSIAYTQILAGALTFIPERHSIGDLFWALFG